MRKSISASLRFNTLHRFGFRCAYCGIEARATKLVVDHLIAVANGGTNEAENLVAACELCNNGKGDKLLTIEPALPPISRRGIKPLKPVKPIVRDNSQWEREEAIAARLIAWIDR